LHAESNLVVVQATVRNREGKPIDGLTKEDFKLLDNGKPQSIIEFESASLDVKPTSGNQAAEPQTAAAPNNYLALYLDDLNMADADAIAVRDAANGYLERNLVPSERVAIVTSSGQTLSNFTGNLPQLQAALLKLHASPRVDGKNNCPDLTDYQAREITLSDNPNSSNAWTMAISEAENRCQMKDLSPKQPGEPTSAATIDFIRSLARRIVEQSEIQTRLALEGLNQLVDLIAQMPGRRSVVVVSRGFMLLEEQEYLDRTIDRAIRSEVLIDSMDPKGLALLMREADVTRGYTPPTGPLIGITHTSDFSRESAAASVLAQVAEGTGGQFIHDNNDLEAGFDLLAGPRGHYTLAFSPTNAKQDGHFHSLKLTLNGERKGFTVKSRRGYFASKAAKQENSVAAVDDDANAIRDAILSPVELQQLPIEIKAGASEVDGGKRELALLIHVDAKALHFHQEAGRHQNTLTFTTAVFDQAGKYAGGQEQRAKIDLSDADLANLLASGVDVKITLTVKPGNYRIRQVVRDSEDKHLAATTRNFAVQ
jgi:VWFA-related protein